MRKLVGDGALLTAFERVSGDSVKKIFFMCLGLVVVLCVAGYFLRVPLTRVIVTRLAAVV